MSDDPSTRYVVLHHTGVAHPHFDFMIESKPAGLLYTWQCYYIPTQMAVTSAERLPNHRSIYLDYEGPISRGRGSVRRVLTGRCLFFRRDFRSFLFVPDKAAFPFYVVGPIWAHYGPNERRLRWTIEGLGEPLTPPVTEPDRP